MNRMIFRSSSFRKPLLRMAPLSMILRKLIVIGCLLSGLASAEELRLNILHFNDVYQYVSEDGKGGLARLATKVAAERAKKPDTKTLVTFGGDLLSPSVASSLTLGRHMIEMMNVIGVDVAVVGNHEFDHGPEVLRERLAESRFPWLASNLRQKRDDALFAEARAFTLYEFGGVKIAMIGVVTDQTPQGSRPGPELIFDEPVAVAATLAAGLRKQGIADIVIALTHLDIADDRKLARTGKVDLILGGHDHEVMAEIVSGVPIFKAGSDARNLVAATLVVDTEHRKIDRIDWVLEAIVAEPHAGVQALIEHYDDAIDKALNVTIGKTDTALDGRTATLRSRESTMGNLVADAFRDALGTDIGIVNGGGMRLDAVIAPGPITRKDIKRLLPLENHVYKLEISGANLTALFDNLAGSLGKDQGHRGAAQYPHVSGMRAVLQPGNGPGHRVAQLEIAGKSIVADQKYSIAVSDFLASGRGNYDLLKGQARLMAEDLAPLETVIVMQFIESHKTVRYQLEHRVIVEQ